MGFWKGRGLAHWAHKEPSLGGGVGTACWDQFNWEENRSEKPPSSPAPDHTDPEPSLTLHWTPSDWLWLCRRPGSPAAPWSFQVEGWRWRYSLLEGRTGRRNSLSPLVPPCVPFVFQRVSQVLLLLIGTIFLFPKCSFTMSLSASRAYPSECHSSVWLSWPLTIWPHPASLTLSALTPWHPESNLIGPILSCSKLAMQIPTSSLSSCLALNLECSFIPLLLPRFYTFFKI